MNILELGNASEVVSVDNPFVKEIDLEQMDRPYETEENQERRELLPEQKKEVQENTGWTADIVESIGSLDEYEIYKEAGLVEANIGEKNCLIRPDINMKQTDGFGRTNQERMEQGLAPLTEEGRPYELHHIGQHQDSPLAELTMQEHRGKGNDAVLHIKTKESEINREEFGLERAEHWQNRACGEVKEYE
jgi:hypothetical protein